MMSERRKESLHTVRQHFRRGPLSVSTQRVGVERVRLDLVLSGGSLGRTGRRGRLEQLDGGRGLLLQLLKAVLRLLELGLQLLEQFVVRLLGVGELLLHRSQLGGALLGIHIDVLLEGGELLRRAVLLGVHGAARAELRLHELCERREVAAALVVLTLLIGGVEVLDRGVATNAKFVAQGFAARGAVNVSDENRLGVLELSAQGVPIRLHLLAMASPRREELDESGLAR
mmetsp:Transcript_60401/g.134617  ORF Transcript_60401/g.134617 Transcript_60401/m.134617 type:complete len:229 (+) Transcript_60401:303-989(+)